MHSPVILHLNDVTQNFKLSALSKIFFAIFLAVVHFIFHFTWMYTGQKHAASSSIHSKAASLKSVPQRISRSFAVARSYTAINYVLLWRECSVALIFHSSILEETLHLLSDKVQYFSNSSISEVLHIRNLILFFWRAGKKFQ